MDTSNPLYMFHFLALNGLHITYNPELDQGVIREDYEYLRENQMIHDTTLSLTLENIRQTLEPIANKTSYYIPSWPQGKVVDISYELGSIRIDHKKKGNYTLETIRVPVNCFYKTE